MILLLPVARSFSKQPLTVTAGSSTLEISRDQIAQSLAVTPPPPPKLGQKTTLPRVSFDKTKLAPFVDELVKKASVEPVPTLMSGTQIVRPGKPGLAPKDKEPVGRIIDALQSRQSISLASQTVDIPMESVAPPVIKNANSDLLARTGIGPVYLTFDDGPGAYTEQILDILKRYNVHATFYVIGRNVPSKASTMQRIRDEGHTIGNHSYNHADLSRLNKAQILQELTTTQAAVQQACGVIPTAFRPPYGAVNPTVREAAASLGLSVDLWTIDTDDWMQPGTNEIVRRVLGRDRAGSVVLLHILHAQTVDALPAIIEGIRAQGYTLN
jgi:peptidoglycan/xylan/chitin deacetylase (PgdA/CDA1 family)